MAVQDATCLQMQQAGCQAEIKPSLTAAFNLMNLIFSRPDLLSAACTAGAGWLPSALTCFS